MISYDDEHKRYHPQTHVIFTIFLAVMVLFFFTLYDAQVKNVDKYLAQSMSKIVDTETVEGSRGIITDRNGKVLVQNRQIYTVTFEDTFETAEERNRAVLRFLNLLKEQHVSFTDSLPLTLNAPFSFTYDTLSSTKKTWFSKFLLNGKWISEGLDDTFTSLTFTATGMKKFSLSSPTVEAGTLFDVLKLYYEIDDSYTDAEARAVIGVLYELSLRNLTDYYVEPFTMAQDIDATLISLINDGRYEGAVVKTESIREYTTPYAAHILGNIGKISDYTEELKEQGYKMDDLIGRSGVELAFEEYLRGKDGTRSITTNEDGKITGEVYSKEPQPGSTVALTIDIDLQAAAEHSLAEKILSLNEDDGYDARGGAVVVMEVGTGEILASASYPTYDPADYSTKYNELLEMPGDVFNNKALQGTYPPGSTFKPITAVAAVETGAITTTTKIRDKGKYTRYQDYQPTCWIYPGGTHGNINVSQAITDSCNYFFYEAGYLTGIDNLVKYATDFGIGVPTGVELPEKVGNMDGPAYRESVGQYYVGGDLLQIAIGQGATLVSPLQLANYTATLVGGGDRYAAHFLKNVKSYDNSEILYDYEPTILSTVEMSNATIEAVKKGMGDLVEHGSISSYFKDAIVSAGAKTGTAQTGGGKTNNGVFICFAPFDDPQIAIAVSVERGGSGAAQASIAVDIINEWFSNFSGEAPLIQGENTLIP